MISLRSCRRGTFIAATGINAVAVAIGDPTLSEYSSGAVPEESCTNQRMEQFVWAMLNQSLPSDRSVIGQAVNFYQRKIKDVSSALDRRSDDWKLMFSCYLLILMDYQEMFVVIK